MLESPDYVEKNREAWTAWSSEYRDGGRRSWAKSDISWGIWSVPEAELGALGELGRWRSKDAVELGCGTAYFSSWLAKMGMRPVGVDITEAQLTNARALQREFGLEFPLIRANAERTPLASRSFDLAISEYGASIWCDPFKWVPEAARLLRPGGTLAFLRNGTVATLCMPSEGAVRTELCRDYFGLHRLEWSDDGSIEFHLPTGGMLRVLRDSGFEVEAIIEIQAPEGADDTRFEYMNAGWARRWPSEEIWRARLRS